MRHLTVPSRVVFGILLVLLVSCGTGHDSDEKYFLISTNVKIPYWQAGSAGLFQAAQQLKVRSEFAGPDSYDPKAEQKAMQEAVQNKASGILISVADPALMKDDIDRAIAAGIPVITVDSDAPASKRLFFIGTDNYHAGEMGGQRLAKELNGKGNVVVFTIPEQANLKERLRGYRDALEASPQIKITRVVDMKGDSRVAFDMATEILGQDKKERTDAFVCLEALAGKEVATVLTSHGVKDKVILAMDTDEARVAQHLHDLCAEAEPFGIRVMLEFMARADGWPALKAAYEMRQTPTGLDHGLAYAAIADVLGRERGERSARRPLT